MKKNQCAVCAKPIGAGLLMCSAHWHRVPNDLQDRVYRTWGRVQRSKAAPAERLELINEYRKARDAAVAAVTPSTV